MHAYTAATVISFKFGHRRDRTVVEENNNKKKKGKKLLFRINMSSASFFNIETYLEQRALVIQEIIAIIGYNDEKKTNLEMLNETKKEYI